MKRWLFVFFAGMTFAASAQTDLPPPNAVAAAPASPSAPDNARYLADPSILTACQARLDAMGNKPCDLIFIGGTTIAQWPKAGKAVWDKFYESRHPLNFGVDGDLTQNVLWRLNNMQVQGLKPKVAVLLSGTYNTANTPHEIADGIKTLLINMQIAFPGVKIILVSILPNERANSKMMQVNSLIRGNADGNTIYYLDLVPLMPSVTVTAGGKTETSFKGIGPDHLNPDAKGYEIWADAMEPLLKKLLGEK